MTLFSRAALLGLAFSVLAITAQAQPIPPRHYYHHHYYYHHRHHHLPPR